MTLLGQSDVILSNSEFTSRVYAKAFKSLWKRKPRVVYPCIDLAAYQPDKLRKGKGKQASEDDSVSLIASFVRDLRVRTELIKN
jgi:alpha-1,3/alpha-1,6-mannosyltransferase